MSVSPRAFARTGTPLPDLVLDVVRVRAEKQMRWIHTGRVIAAVEDVEAGGDRAIRQFPDCPVGGDADPADPDLSIAMSVPAGHPRPARIGTTGLVDLGPEPGLDRCGYSASLDGTRDAPDGEPARGTPAILAGVAMPLVIPAGGFEAHDRHSTETMRPTSTTMARPAAIPTSSAVTERGSSADGGSARPRAKSGSRGASRPAACRSTP